MCVWPLLWDDSAVFTYDFSSMVAYIGAQWVGVSLTSLLSLGSHTASFPQYCVDYSFSRLSRWAEGTSTSPLNRRGPNEFATNLFKRHSSHCIWRSNQGSLQTSMLGANNSARSWTSSHYVLSSLLEIRNCHTMNQLDNAVWPAAPAWLLTSANNLYECHTLW